MLVAIALVALTGLACQAAPSQPLVRIQEGTVIGSTGKSRSGREIFQFRGIPYAEAPVGELRFRSPVPRRPWNRKTLKAIEAGSVCPQIQNGTYVGDEDCLNLEVYTPSLKRNAQMPVMFWIHGGSFTTRTPLDFNPAYMLDKDVVLVIVNYRLGALGFASTGDDEIPGNFGLKDQVLAMKWVQRNIRAFGGDSRRVTIFGESAGAACVNLHAMSDSSNGLYHQYIVESGPATSPWAFKDIRLYSAMPKKVADLYNCSAETSAEVASCLRQLTPQQLVNSDSAFDILARVGYTTWAPTMEQKSKDAILTDSPTNLLNKKKMKDYPFIIGHVKDEGLLITTTLYENDELYQKIVSNLDTVLGFFLSNIAESEEERDKLVVEVKEYYFKNADWNVRADVIKRITEFLGDFGWIQPESDMLDRQVAFAKNNIYQYSFEYRGTFSVTSITLQSNQNVGVTHGDELIYLYSSILPSITENDFKVVDAMTDLWTSFATTGIPKSSHLDTEIWTPYGSEQNYIQIGNDKDPSVRTYRSYLSQRMKGWMQYTSLNLKSVLKYR